jgi:hypothetical protein
MQNPSQQQIGPNSAGSQEEEQEEELESNCSSLGNTQNPKILSLAGTPGSFVGKGGKMSERTKG